MADTNHIILAILKFFDDQQRSPDLSPDAVESLEVASQCLESAYGISIRDVDVLARYPLPASLPEIFNAGVHTMTTTGPVDHEAAEKLKNEGNDYMRNEDYKSAIDCYSRAIQLDSRNAIYYANRAAAYSKSGDNTRAIEDCDKAITIDPNYSKAYGRKGLAFSALGRHIEAKACYKKASELDPANESYRDNLRHAEAACEEMTGLGGTTGGMGGLNLGGMDLSSLLSNPALMNMATSMLSNPQMQSMMANLMSNTQGGDGQPQGISSLLQAGQQLAQQMQQQNPELVEQLKQQMKPENKKPDDAANGS